ncbi:probable serine hydrolase [Coccinella septempunctata]|uniref:probable serine hydrolase n=1 Tax=Coccinella septempunctata TaxID=41139 RepID=UPI001D086513|nr:probable serine hydrolase [Coccinella septempunctata]
MLSVLRNVSVNQRNIHYISRKPFKEVSIPVPWGKIAGKWWGSTKIKPIICLHGVQDNCGSFEPLVVFLNKKENFSFLAIDFPGHGYSSRFPGGLFYHFFTYPMVVKRICDYFKWQNVSLMGHSLGAITSFTFTILYPEKVKFLICIDALHPFTTTVNAETLRKSIDLLMKYDDMKSSENMSAAYSLQEAIEKMYNGYENAIKLERIPILLERNLSPSKNFPGKYYFSRDPKLKMKVMCDWPQEQVIKDSSLITQPIFVCKARHNMYYGPKEHFYSVMDVLKKNSKDCDFHYVDGTHYVHLNDPEDVGAYIQKFLEKHYKAEQSNLDENSSVFCDSHPGLLEMISKQ